MYGFLNTTIINNDINISQNYENEENEHIHEIISDIFPNQNKLGEELRLIDFVESRIPKSNFGDNIHGNLFEALVGAIYLDRGYKFCEKFINTRVINPHIDIEALEGKVISYKSLLIEWCQKEKHTFDFQVYEDTGKDELKHFSVKLSINNKVIAKARATSKKKAEEKASKRAFFAFQGKISRAI